MKSTRWWSENNTKTQNKDKDKHEHTNSNTLWWMPPRMKSTRWWLGGFLSPWAQFSQQVHFFQGKSPKICKKSNSTVHSRQVQSLQWKLWSNLFNHRPCHMDFERRIHKPLFWGDLKRELTIERRSNFSLASTGFFGRYLNFHLCSFPPTTSHTGYTGDLSLSIKFVCPTNPSDQLSQ